MIHAFIKFYEVIMAGLIKVDIKKIEKLLMQRGLNYTTLGKKMGGISGSAVSEMFMQINKKGRLLRLDTVYRLARALEVEPETILATDDDTSK